METADFSQMTALTQSTCASAHMVTHASVVAATAGVLLTLFNLPPEAATAATTLILSFCSGVLALPI
jgi:hypothetical protein